ncbi:MAG: CHAD domain-containing protein [Rhodospirillales bacterium]
MGSEEADEEEIAGEEGIPLPFPSPSPVGSPIVLQFAVDAGAFRQLGEADYPAWAKSDAIRRHLKSTYFDTEDQRLARRGLSLNVRSDGRRYSQKLTAENSGENGSAEASDWQGEITTAAPQLEAIDNPELRERLGFLSPDALIPLFTTDIKREERIVEVFEGGQDNLIAVALDQGEIGAGSTVARLSEVKLKLLQGLPAALYRFGLAVLERVPLALEPQSRAARGFALVSGTPPSWSKAFSVQLDTEMTVEDGMVCILSACVGQLLANQAAVADGRDPEGVHQFRVALRRLRSALTTFKPVLPPTQLDHFQEAARWSVRALNPARDWDVFLDELLPPVGGAPGVDQGRFAALQAGVGAARAAGYEEARAMLRSPRYTRLVLETALWLDERGWRREASAPAAERLGETISGYAGVLLDKRHGSARKRGRGFDNQPAEERHRLRIALKKLRYATEFFRSLYPAEQTRPYLARLKSLQDTLGHMNDVATAERLIGSLIDGRTENNRIDGELVKLAVAGGRILGWYAHAVEAVEPKARRAWREFKASEVFW